MIISRTAFRISFCGGGSDLPAFYEKEEGCVISTTIDRHMYVSVHPYFEPGQISLKYSRTELVDNADAIEHKILRETLKQYGIHGVEITSTADIPAGTGLGSSSTFTVGLLNTLHAYMRCSVSKEKLAEKACDLEINRLGSPIGKQDQYAAAFGGFNLIRFLPDGKVIVEPVRADSGTLHELEKNLILFYTGKLHNANRILSEQNRNTKTGDKTLTLREMCGLAKQMRIDLEEGRTADFGKLLHENWLLKKSLAASISSSDIDELYQKGMQNGAEGGKILGAGGGGFLLFCCKEERQKTLETALGLRRFPFRFEEEGSRIIFRDDNPTAQAGENKDER